MCPELPSFSILHLPSVLGPCLDIPDWRDSWVRGWDSSLGFDHSSERGEKNHSEFHLLWCWERGTGMG